MAENKVIAIDLGGTNMRVGLAEGNGIVRYVKKDTPKKSKELLDTLVSSIEEVIARDKISGIGIAMPGPLKEGVVKNPPNLALKNFNLKKYLEKKFKTKVEICNDADCVALAEAKLGCKKKNFIILTLGTGVGGGIVINGELYHGKGYGGELGHLVLNDGKFFEDLVAGKRLNPLTKKKFGREMMIKDLMDEKSKKADAIVDEFADYLGQGIGSLINVFDPEVVVIAGGVRESGNKFLNKIKKAAKKYVILPTKTKIEWSKLDHPGILGAGLLVK